MAYTKTIWVEGVTDLGPDNHNHAEDGIYNAHVTADAAIPKPGSPATSDGLVWNGSTWVSQKIADASIAAAADIAFSKVRVSKGANPPGSPSTGDLWEFPVDAATGVNWMFVYNAGSASAFKWEYVGGANLEARVDTSEGTNSATYVDLATNGPQITISRAGDYFFHYGFQATNTAVSPANAQVMLGKNGVDVGATVSASFLAVGATGHIVTGTRAAKVTGLAVSDTIRLRYAISNSVAINFFGRYLIATPIRVI